MPKINVITCDAEKLEHLVKYSALTIEGLALDSIKDFLEWIENYTPLKKHDVYVTSGRLANSAWHLHGDNAYPDDLNIVSVQLDDIEDFNKIVIPRFQIGARWMDDIHDNNVRREEEAA